MTDFDENLIFHELYLHLLWSTKNQEPLLASVAKHLYDYMEELALTCESTIVGGRIVNDHVQLVIKFSPETSLGELITTLKVATSLWIRTNFSELKNFEWQQSDFSFTLGTEEIGGIIDSFNHVKSFPDEIPSLLNQNGLEYTLQTVLE